MSRDVRELLEQTAPAPTRPLDARALVDRAVRQRRLTFAAGAAAATAVVVFAVLVFAEIGPPRPLEILPVDEPVTSVSDEAQLWCLDVAFDVEDWEDPEPLAADDELSADVRDAFDPDIQTEPEVLHTLDLDQVNDLRVVTRGEREALLVLGAGNDGGSDARGRLGIVFEQTGDWIFGRSGQCRPEVRHPSGAPAAAWEPVETPEPDSTRIDVHVRERRCASGQRADDRLLPPHIEMREDEVMVAWFVERVTGDASCPGNPTTPATLELPEPLGNRELLDGGVYPPRPPDADPGA